jgi:3-hydroxyacyl-[acyl-carrier-protein] dehydratase
VPAHAALSHSSSFIVPADHPALPGHFPGDPLVPGVVILDRVIEAAEDWLERRLSVVGVPQAKFVAPLRPGERADVSLALDDSTLSFAVHRDGVPISRGTLRLQRPVAP